MTLPRQVLAGASYLVSRRCAQREFLLQPTALTTSTFKYVLAVAAKRHRMLVHAVCVMGNHYHLVVTDPHAELPRFTQFLDGVLARALNASYGRWEAFWAPSSYSAVRLVSPIDVLAKIVYTLANPVSAGLVSQARDWPGLWSSPDRIGAGGESAPRPDHFFSQRGSMPEREELVFTVPPGFDSAAEFRAELQRRLAVREAARRKHRNARGRAFLGVLRVMRQKRTDSPKSRAPRRGVRPRVAARDRWRRLEALRRLAGFVRAYREALRSLRHGQWHAVFPHGTYLLRVHLGVACQPP